MKNLIKNRARKLFIFTLICFVIVSSFIVIGKIDSSKSITIEENEVLNEPSSGIIKSAGSDFYPATDIYNYVSGEYAQTGNGTVNLNEEITSATDIFYVWYRGTHYFGPPKGFTWITVSSSKPNVATATATSTSNGLKVDFQAGYSSGTTKITIEYTITQLSVQEGIAQDSDTSYAVSGTLVYTVENDIDGDETVSIDGKPEFDYNVISSFTNSTYGAVRVQCSKTSSHVGKVSNILLHPDGYTLSKVIPYDNSVSGVSSSDYPWMVILTLNNDYWVSLFNSNYASTWGTHYLNTNKTDIVSTKFLSDGTNWYYITADAPLYVYVQETAIKYNYSLTYNPNGGNFDGSVSSKYHRVQNSTVTSQTFTVRGNDYYTTLQKEGYEFKGWSDTPDGGVDYEVGSTITLTAPSNLQKTIYAVWEEATPSCVHEETSWVDNKDGRTHDEICDECSAVITDNENHTWGEWKVTKPVSCLENGVETATCTKCGATKTRDIIAPGSHIDDDKDHYCDRCDWELSKCEDNNNDHKCDYCGKTLSVCADNNNDHKCDVCGAETSQCKDENQDHKCDICGKELTDHDWGTWEDDDNGNTHTHVCRFTGCSASETGNHSWGEWEVSLEDDSIEIRKCEVCRAQEERKVTPNICEHEWDEGTIIKEPTCEEPGIRKYACIKDSDHVYTEDIPANGHKWGKWLVVKEPTCEEEGLRKRICLVCGKEEEEILAPIEHDWDDWIYVYGDADVTNHEYGKKKKICKHNTAHVIEEPISYKEYVELVKDPIVSPNTGDNDVNKWFIIRGLSILSIIVILFYSIASKKRLRKE